MKRFLGHGAAAVTLTIAAFMAGNITTASSQSMQPVLVAAGGQQCAKHFDKVGEVPNMHYRCMLQFQVKCRRGYVLAYEPNLAKVGGGHRVLYGCKKATRELRRRIR